MEFRDIFFFFWLVFSHCRKAIAKSCWTQPPRLPLPFNLPSVFTFFFLLHVSSFLFVLIVDPVAVGLAGRHGTEWRCL